MGRRIAGGADGGGWDCIMSAWINWMRPALILLLAACVAPSGGGSATKILGGAITVALPAGYCIDPKSGHGDGQSALVIAGRCSAARPVPAAAITISVGGEGSSAILKSGARALSDWARSQAGRAALARDGSARSVAVRETLIWDGAFLIHLEDRATGPYWRGAIGIKGRLVMISVSPPSQRDLSLEAGRKVLEGVIGSLRRANATGP
jgi:hypothetical protein